MGSSAIRLAIRAALALALPCGVAADPAPFSEYEVKSAMLVNFALFVDWPPPAFQNARQPFTIGVLGPDPFGRALDEVAREKAVNGHPVQVRRIEQWPSSEPVHILFISKMEKRKLKAFLAGLSGQPVLTVSDTDGFADHGGVIGLTMEDGRVKFEVNLEAAEKAGLSLSSKLLRLAAKTRPAAGRGGA